jgi:crotonobetainyl-CoA:carnitine CoA-transferase CaiB-like acyl-CoA transferase
MAAALEPTHGTGAFMGYLEAEPEGRLLDGGIPNKVANSYTDFLASITAQLAVLAALIHRKTTGRGVWVDLAMYQVGVSFLGEGLLDFAFNGRRTRRLGNRHEYMSPHGCYPCLGEDQWITIAVRDDEDWSSFCQAIEQPSLAVDPRFVDPFVRYGNQEALDAVITDWTSRRTPYQVMETLQAKGVPAGAVLNAGELLRDPHFRARGFFETVEHPLETGLGQQEYLGRGWRFSDMEASTKGPAPMLGEANDYVLHQVLGLTSEEIQHLRETGVIGTALQGGQPPSIVPLARQVELGGIAAYDPDFRNPPESVP